MKRRTTKTLSPVTYDHPQATSGHPDTTNLGDHVFDFNLSGYALGEGRKVSDIVPGGVRLLLCEDKGQSTRCGAYDSTITNSAENSQGYKKAAWLESKRRDNDWEPEDSAHRLALLIRPAQAVSWHLGTCSRNRLWVKDPGGS